MNQVAYCKRDLVYCEMYGMESKLNDGNEQ